MAVVAQTFSFLFSNETVSETVAIVPFYLPPSFDWGFVEDLPNLDRQVVYYP
jgi:hypothetical protein